MARKQRMVESKETKIIYLASILIIRFKLNFFYGRNFNARDWKHSVRETLTKLARIMRADIRLVFYLMFHAATRIAPATGRNNVTIALQICLSFCSCYCLSLILFSLCSGQRCKLINTFVEQQLLPIGTESTWTCSLITKPSPYHHPSTFFVALITKFFSSNYVKQVLETSCFTNFLNLQIIMCTVM